MHDQAHPGYEKQAQNHFAKTGFIKPRIKPEPGPGSCQKQGQSDHKEPQRLGVN
jgi:hypothetical protein